MKRRKVFLGDTPVKVNEEPVKGEFIEQEGERFYRISNVDQMPEFFISLVSASDLWMFISSNGSLTAGRKNPETALFPYYSEDKIHDYRGKTGSSTLIQVADGNKFMLWEPFAAAGSYSIQRNLYKNKSSNRMIFEEINRDLELTFRYCWYNSDRFGFIKNSSLLNQGARPVQLELLDGLQNILPASVNPALQLSSSNLLDAYKRQELVKGTSLAIYRLSSVPSDLAEPSESLLANTVWSEGLDAQAILLSDRQRETFRWGYKPEQETDIKASRGAYFIYSSLELQAGVWQKWNIIADVNQDSSAVASLVSLLQSGDDLGDLLQAEIDHSQRELDALLASSDAMQNTADELSTARHLSNVLFNIMRGGIFLGNYQVPAADFISHIENANKALVKEARKLVEGREAYIAYDLILQEARAAKNPQLLRLSYEYLALTFSRRHGDPSRPWNRFSIENRKGDGSRNLDYQGNWRDIFQNWEALSISFPAYVESMISKFVNASTADGYNPYRITRDGIDWEVPDPSDPWSNIGYWGDHQVIYLLRFLDISMNHHPGMLEELLSMEIFSYANVPYRIRSYRELLEDPRDTIEFDSRLEEEIQSRIQTLGSDGRLVWDKAGRVVMVNLAEKLLLTLLVKLSNFIPGAGIWMNTQRPEWNDANNALVGYGVSMVTTYYLRAYVEFCIRLFKNFRQESLKLSMEVLGFFADLNEALKEQLPQSDWMLTGKGMKTCMDLFGEAGSNYRQRFYRDGFSGKRREIGRDEVLAFLESSLELLNITISSNQRPDRLYHAYNLIRIEEEQIHLRRLYEMLEGQVAVLSSGYLTAGESLELLDALKKSKLFRKDQYSYILYPDRELPSFMDHNIIPEAEVERSKLLRKLIVDSDSRIVEKDVNGVCHFHADFRNAGILEKALDRLPETYKPLLEKDRGLILEIYEKVFDHQSFTGRSGTFYGYEGLGCIYWHMVSKLLLAVNESYHWAAEHGGHAEVLGKLAAHYYEIRAGIGLNKAPEVYGAFPADPYSHTPGNRGAQQPGMTGQVKEDILARWGELGILVRDGSICFSPILLRKAEFLSSPQEFSYLDLHGERQTLELEPDSLAFTYCQVPVIYHHSKEKQIVLYFSDGTEELIQGHYMDPVNSDLIFSRKGRISRIAVWLEPGL